jgi:hypothetical protein
MHEQLTETVSPAHVIEEGQSKRVSEHAFPSTIDAGLGHAGHAIVWHCHELPSHVHGGGMSVQ